MLPRIQISGKHDELEDEVYLALCLLPGFKNFLGYKKVKPGFIESCGNNNALDDSQDDAVSYDDSEETENTKDVKRKRGWRL